MSGAWVISRNLEILDDSTRIGDCTQASKGDLGICLKSLGVLVPWRHRGFMGGFIVEITVEIHVSSCGSDCTPRDQVPLMSALFVGKKLHQTIVKIMPSPFCLDSLGIIRLSSEFAIIFEKLDLKLLLLDSQSIGGLIPVCFGLLAFPTLAGEKNNFLGRLEIKLSNGKKKIPLVTILMFVGLSSYLFPIVVIKKHISCWRRLHCFDAKVPYSSAEKIPLFFQYNPHVPVKTTVDCWDIRITSFFNGGFNIPGFCLGFNQLKTVQAFATIHSIFMWLKQCHLHHPPVITIFIGGIQTIPSHGW